MSDGRPALAIYQYCRYFVFILKPDNLMALALSQDLTILRNHGIHLTEEDIPHDYVPPVKEEEKASGNDQEEPSGND